MSLRSKNEEVDAIVELVKEETGLPTIGYYGDGLRQLGPD